MQALGSDLIPQFNFPFQANERNALQLTPSQSAECQLQRWQRKYFLLGTEPACVRGLLCTYTCAYMVLQEAQEVPVWRMEALNGYGA